ncbi:hypothetical protein LSUE1_G002201 [Lachnellula suecica]|uniref:SnoaL-like domain-containing protein n=1 Tax=Lachnellula suecica TaxID=602035 RepID=A0A8T9CLG9_9HELO|nr:hypothetical protein LSUE1_G002201 [Lachnellula suecica]
MNFVLFLSLFSMASAASFCPSRAVDAKEQVDIWGLFVKKFYFDKEVQTAFADHIASDFIEHNPDALSGWNQTNIAGLAGLISESNFTVMHDAFSNNTGYMHIRQDTSGAQPLAIADIFRFNGSCIVEHWDIQQARPVDPINPLAMW